MKGEDLKVIAYGISMTTKADSISSWSVKMERFLEQVIF